MVPTTPVTQLRDYNMRFLISEVSINGNEMSISLTNVDSLPECEEFQ